MQRSFLIFQNSLRSKESVKGYTYRLKRFQNFYHLKDYDSIVTISAEKLQIMIEDYVMDLKKKISANSIPSYIHPLKLFLECSDIDLNWRKIKRLFPEPVKPTGDSAYSTKDIKKMLDCTPNLRNRALIHFLASTGCRIGAFPDMKLKHLSEMPNGCKQVQVYEDSIEEYFTFLTPEASKILDEYIEQRKKDNEILNSESPVFRTKYSLGISKAKSMTKKAMQAVIDRAVRNAGIRYFSEKKNGRYLIQLDHGFRKRFNTILKTNNDVNSNIAEKLMGHKRGLDRVYLKPTKEQCFEEFRKAIPELSINESVRLQYKNQQQQEKLQKYEIDAKYEIESMKKDMHKHKLDTLRLIGEALQNPEKFKEKIVRTD